MEKKINYTCSCPAVYINLCAHIFPTITCICALPLPFPTPPLPPSFLYNPVNERLVWGCKGNYCMLVVVVHVLVSCFFFLCLSSIIWFYSIWFFYYFFIIFFFSYLIWWKLVDTWCGFFTWLSLHIQLI